MSELSIQIRPRYEASITIRGIEESQIAIFEKGKIFITEVYAGQGRASDPFTAYALADPIEGAWGFITSEEWDETGKEFGVDESDFIPRTARVFNGIIANTNPDNPAQSVMQNAFIREVLLMAVRVPDGITREELTPDMERFAYAYAWLPEGEADINNILVPPDLTGKISAYMPFRLPVFLTTQEDAVLVFSFTAENLVTLGMLEQHTRQTICKNQDGVHGIRAMPIDETLPIFDGEIQIKCGGNWYRVLSGSAGLPSNMYQFSDYTTTNAHIQFSDTELSRLKYLELDGTLGVTEHTEHGKPIVTPANSALQEVSISADYIIFEDGRTAQEVFS